MRSFKDPSFQDRIGSAAEAKKKALDNLRSKPPLDEKLVAERQAARLRREAAAAALRADEAAKRSQGRQGSRALRSFYEQHPGRKRG
jgi:hypothetical protein